jgi:sodium-dependent dicarboxylate transporter 2/3/5
MEISGLADWVLNWHVFSHPGLILVATFCLAGALLSMFISNTATANLIIPLAVSIPGENPIILAIVIALSCSVGMALPISTPPNAMAFSTNAFSGRDMFKAGSLVCLISLLVILLGFNYVLGGIAPTP